MEADRRSKRSFMPIDMAGSYNYNAVGLFPVPNETGKPEDYYPADLQGGAILIGEMTYSLTSLPNSTPGNILNTTETDGVTLTANNVQVLTQFGGTRRGQPFAAQGPAQEVITLEDRHKVFTVKTGFCNTFNTGFKRIKAGHYVFARHLKKGETYPTVETGRPRAYPVMEPFTAPFHVTSRAITQVRERIANQSTRIVQQNLDSTAIKKLIREKMFSQIEPAIVSVEEMKVPGDDDAFSAAWQDAFDSDVYRIKRARTFSSDSLDKKADRLGLLELYITNLISVSQYKNPMNKLRDMTTLMNKTSKATADIAADFQNEYCFVGRAQTDADPSFMFRINHTTSEG